MSFKDKIKLFFENFFTENKGALITLFIIFLLVFLSQNVNASFKVTDINNIEYSLPDLPVDSENFDSRYFSIYVEGDYYYLLSYVNYNSSTMKIINTNATSGYMGIVNSNGKADAVGEVKFWHCRKTSSSWILDSWQPRSYDLSILFWCSDV